MLKRITHNFTVSNILAAIIVLVLCVTLLVSTEGRWWGNVLMAVGLLEGVLLITGVLYMRRQIRAIGGGMHERLVWIHLINFIIWSIFFVVQNFVAIGMEEISGDKSSAEEEQDIDWLHKAFSAEFVGLFQYLIQTYMDLFLLYLISKFSEKKQEEKIFDRVLNRKVSAMVYI